MSEIIPAALIRTDSIITIPVDKGWYSVHDTLTGEFAPSQITSDLDFTNQTGRVLTVFKQEAFVMVVVELRFDVAWAEAGGSAGFRWTILIPTDADVQLAW